MNVSFGKSHALPEMTREHKTVKPANHGLSNAAATLAAAGVAVAGVTYLANTGKLAQAKDVLVKQSAKVAEKNATAGKVMNSVIKYATKATKAVAKLGNRVAGGAKTLYGSAASRIDTLKDAVEKKFNPAKFGEAVEKAAETIVE